MNETLTNLQKEIDNKKLLMSRIKAAIKNVNNNVEPTEITMEEMLELLNSTAGDEEFYESQFTISWCGFKCSLDYGAETYENITGTIDSSIEWNL